MEATQAILQSVGSHSVSVGPAWKVDHEGCYPRLTAVWRGVPVSVEMEASRYVFADGDWSEWRVYVRQARPHVSDTAISRLTDVCRPLVFAWLESDGYAVSRQQAFAWLIRRELRDTRYTYGPGSTLLAKYGEELSANDLSRLTEAVSTLARLLELLEVGE